MQVILLDHIEKVGSKHDVVKVKDGFGRNYLLPKGLALVANRENLNRLEGLKKQASKKRSRPRGRLQGHGRQIGRPNAHHRR